jgi:hypothetical protein
VPRLAELRAIKLDSATYHPAAISRAPTPEARTEAFEALVADLRRASALLRGELTPTEPLDRG